MSPPQPVGVWENRAGEEPGPPGHWAGSGHLGITQTGVENPHSTLADAASQSFGVVSPVGSSDQFLGETSLLPHFASL